MKIALIAEAMDSGVGRLVCQYAAGLANRGHDIHLLHSFERTSAETLECLQALPAVKRKAIGMRRGAHWSDVSAAIAIRQYLVTNGPFDIVHGHSSKGGMLARTASLGLSGRRVYTPHAFYTLSPTLSPVERAIYGAAEWILSRLCSVVVCSSVVELDHARALGIPSNRLTIVHNGIALPDLDPPARHRFGFPESSVIAGFVGRLDPQKAPDTLLEALALAMTSVPELRAVIIGSGTQDAFLRSLAVRLGIADRIQWLGYQRSTQYLSSFDMLLQPSRYEGFSLMPLEAMHAGLPIVCTPVGGIAETVVDEVSGIVVPVDDVGALASATVALARNAKRRQAMGRAARMRADAFTADRMVGAIEDVYRAVGAPAHRTGPVEPEPLRAPWTFDGGAR